MNNVELIGRITRDPEVRYTNGSQMAVATFTIAIDRPQRQGAEKQTDFPRVTVFGKQAETCQKYLKKGRMVAIQGRLQTGSYQDKNGNTVYTTDVVANRVEFIDWGNNQSGQGQGQRQNQAPAAPAQGQYQAPVQNQAPAPAPQYAPAPAPVPAPAAPQYAVPAQNVQQAPPAPAPQYEVPQPDPFEGIDEDVPF